jgi:hypothetical protein
VVVEEQLVAKYRMNKDDQFHRDMQRYIAVTTIGPSTLRNQKARGVIEAAQKYLAGVELTAFIARNEDDFLESLKIQTEQLRTALPLGAQNWGAARKALNLFLRDVCYNRFLCERYDLARSEDWMEIPLDGLVARSLKRKAGRGKLPPWPGLIELTAEISRCFQAFAKDHAVSKGISRIHLDMRLWTEERGGHGELDAPENGDNVTPIRNSGAGEDLPSGS